MREAEKHLRKATEIYPNYAAGWVMLGQILETRQQSAGAREACSRASGSDSNHLPAYLCSFVQRRSRGVSCDGMKF